MTHTSHSTPAHTPRPVDAETATLLHRAQAGDRDAFGQLYVRYVAGVHRYVAARLRGRDRDAVADLVHDTFTAALQDLHRAHEDVQGWLLQLAARMCTRHSRRQRYDRRTIRTVAQQQRSQAATVAQPAPPAIRHHLSQALAILGTHERRTLQLRFLEGHPQQTTADIMTCSRRSVRRRQQRALRQLAAHLAGRPNPRTPALAS